MGSDEHTCPHHEEVERRLGDGKEKMSKVLDALQENNRQLERLITNQDNQQQDVDNLKKEVWGKDGGNGLKGRQQKTSAALTVFMGLVFGSGGIWGLYQFLKALSQ